MSLTIWKIGILSLAIVGCSVSQDKVLVKEVCDYLVSEITLEAKLKTSLKPSVLDPGADSFTAQKFFPSTIDTDGRELSFCSYASDGKQNDGKDMVETTRIYFTQESIGPTGCETKDFCLTKEDISYFALSIEVGRNAHSEFPEYWSYPK